MRKTSIILAPVVSEKSFRLAAAGQYTFLVDPRVTAADVAHAISELYQVTVVSIRTLTGSGRATRYRGINGRRSHWKKAMVTLKAGQRIAGFEVVEAPAEPATTEPTSSTAPSTKRAAKQPTSTEPVIADVQPKENQ